MEKAIVIGGSIAGKFAAKALSRISRQVVILEADQEWTEKTPRKRVSQSFHPHVLLKGGQEAIEKLFPNLFDHLIADGSIANNFTKDLKWHHFGSWKPRFLGELEMVQQSRPLMEWHLQKRIDEISTISTRYETSVEQLVTDPESQKVLGVRVRSLQTGREEELYADLVVDASGYGSKSIKWLREMEVEVKKEKVKIGLFYATSFFTLSEDEPSDWCNLLISPSFPENPYGAYIQSIEGKRFSVTFSGYANESAPKTTEELFAYAQKLPVPDVTLFLERAVPISEIYIHKIPYQEWRRFDLAAVPEGLLVVGDAHCHFDPVFGQGMSVAAMEALELQRCLEHSKFLNKRFAKDYHKRISKLISIPWEMTITEAFRHPNIEGNKPILLPIKQWYSKKIYQLSAVDPDIYLRLVRVMNLLKSPLHFFHPKVWFSILTRK